MKYTLLTILLFCSTLSFSQDWETLVYNPDQDSLVLNPLKGLTPLYNVNNDFPHSIRGKIVGFDSIMFGLDNFKWDVFDNFLDTTGWGGRFGYMQVNVDLAFNRSGLPAFLSNVEHYVYDGTDPDDGAGVPSLVVNYNNEEMMTAMLNFIEAFGERYNDDPRVFLVHYGLYGIFGEWDIGFGKKFIPAGEEWEMTEANQRRITDAYEAAFDNKNLLARFPENVPESQAVGYSDGFYFGGSVSDDPNYQWFFHPKLKLNNADLNWKNYPIGGEVDPDVQSILWDDFPNDVIGLPGVTQNTEDVFNLTRPTFLFQDFMFNNITRDSNTVRWDNAIKATKRTGYTFHINEVRITAADQKPAVEVNIQNKGLAPMYANWEVELGYIDANGDVQSLGTDSNWNIRSIQPDVDENYRSIVSTSTIADGTHTFVLRIINPLETISSGAKPVRFANATQDEDELGWLTLGEATITGGALGAALVKVTGVSITPETTSLGLEDQLQLTATVSPTMATDSSITWSSNRPQTAAVDANGMVTTYSLGGDVEITASTQDGGYASVSNISVQPFWVIPKKVEAEGFSDIFNAQVNPVPAGEDGGSVLGFIGDDTWMEYIVQVNEEAEFVVDFRASSPAAEGEINILNTAGNIISKVALTPGTANYDTYGTYTSTPFTLPVGTDTLRLDVVTSSFNLNWIEFRLPGECEVPVGSFCDDGDIGTENDTYSDDCVCIGTPDSIFTDIPGLIEAEDYNTVFNAQVNPTPVGEPTGEILGFIGDDTWMEYGVRVAEEAEFQLDLRAASPFGVSVIDILNTDGDSITTINLTPATADYDTYGLFSSEKFTLPAGSYILRLDVVASAFNLNWLEFRFPDPCANPVGSTCDDGIATTINDIINEDCECEGTPDSIFTAIPSLIEAEDYYQVFDAQINPTPDGEDPGSVLGFIGDDTWMEYGVAVATEATYVVDFRAASPFGISVINVLNQAGDTLTTINLAPATASYDTYGIYTSDPFTLPAGNHLLRLDVIASGFNLNWIEFRVSDGCANPVGTSCDDGDATTINDAYNDNCECAGIPATAFTPIPSLIEAEDYYNLFDAQVNPTPDGEDSDSVLGFIGDDTWMEYAVTVSEETEFVMDVRAASPFGLGLIRVLNVAGDSLSSIALTPATADYDTYGTFSSIPFTLPAGNHLLRLDVVVSAFNLNWIEFRATNGCTNPVGTSCDDGDANTINDVYTADCECVGTPDTPTPADAKPMQAISGGDIYIEDAGYGVIMKSADGQCWRYAPDENGVLVGTSITCPE